MEIEPKKQLSGGARLKLSGKHPILLGVSEEHFQEFSAAAAIENRPVTQFVIHHALMAARKISRKSRISAE